MKISAFTKNTCPVVADEAVSVLNKHLEPWGIRVTRQNGRFTPQNFTMKMVFSVIQANGLIEPPEAIAFKSNAWRYGLKPEDLGKVFSYNHSNFKISGIKTRGHKFPILATECGTGKTFKFGASIVKTLLEKV